MVEEEILARTIIHDLPAASRPSFLQAAVQDSIAGGRIYDAHIADVARAAGAR